MGTPLAMLQRLSGCEEVTWVQVGPFTPWRAAWQARGRAPPALMWIVDQRMIGWSRILRWWTSQRDRLTANFSAASKLPSQTALHDTKNYGGDTCPSENHTVSFQPPKKKYSPRMLPSEKMRVIDLALHPILIWRWRIISSQRRNVGPWWGWRCGRPNNYAP